MLGFDAEDHDAIYGTSKFVEDVPLLILLKLGEPRFQCKKFLISRKVT